MSKNFGVSTAAQSCLFQFKVIQAVLEARLISKKNFFATKDLESGIARMYLNRATWALSSASAFPVAPAHSFRVLWEQTTDLSLSNSNVHALGPRFAHRSRALTWKG